MIFSSFVLGVLECNEGYWVLRKRILGDFKECVWCEIVTIWCFKRRETKT
jgi:hypothetical protein